MTDRIIKIPPSSQNGNAVYFIAVTRTIGGVPTEIFIPTSYEADMPTYVATIPASLLAANKNHASLVNKTGSGKTIRILHIYATPSMSAAVAGLQVTLEIHGIAANTPTAGTLITIRNHDTDDGALPAQVEARGNPTATPLANWILASGVVNPEETSARGGQSEIFKKEGNVSALILRENEGVLIRQTALAGAGNINLHIVFQSD